jgi:methyltransferase family protein
MRAVLRTLLPMYRGNLSGLRIADLGTLEGGYALALAQRGATVLGIEAREQNFVKLELLQEHFDQLNLKFIKADVKDFTLESFGEFDTVLALGILYHLDNPAQWLSQISDTVKDILIIDSHFAPATDEDLKLLRPEFNYLGPLEKIEMNGWTCEGRWFFEYAEDVDRESQLWASYSNNRSFWMTKESLLLALWHAGFALVLEQHDYNVDRYKLFRTAYPRAFFIAIKDSAFASGTG